MDARQPHHDGRIVHVVIGHVIHVWLGCDQLVALLERDLHDQRIRLGGFVDRLTGHELATNLELRRAVRGALLDTGQRQGEFANGIKAEWL